MPDGDLEAMELNARIPAGPLAEKWDRHKFELKLVNPANKRKYTHHRGRHRPGRRRRPRPRSASWATTSSASASRTARAARTASPPRAASTRPRTTRTTATASTGCSTTPSRAATSAPARPTSTGWPRSASTSSTSAWRRACRSPASTAACSPTARSAARRSRAPSTRAARPASSCCSAPTRRWSGRSRAGTVKMYPAHRDARPGRRRRPGARHRRRATWSPARSSRYAADAVVLATGGYGNVFYLSTNAKGCNVTATWRAYKRGAAFANPCFTQIHPTCIPVSGDYQSKLTLMSESLRNDGRVWVPKQQGRHARAGPDPRGRARLLPRAEVPELRQPRRRATSPRAPPRRSATRAAASGRDRAAASTSTSPTPSSASARTTIRERYGNLFEMYERITGRGSLPGADADLSRPSTTRWAGCGWTTT